MDFLRSIFKMRGPFDSAPDGRRPDFNRFLQAVTTHQAGPVPVADLFADRETVSAFLNEPVYDPSEILLDPQQRIPPKAIAGAFKYVDQTIRFCINTGWDYAYTSSTINFGGLAFNKTSNISPLDKASRRFFLDDNTGPIGSWEDFEKYPWPTDFHGANLLPRAMARRVPDGMKIMVMPGGVFEWTTWLMGLLPFSYALADQPDLVQAVLDKVSATILAVVEDLLDEPNVGGIFMGDDLGYGSGTLVSPAILQRQFFPQTKRVIDLVHRAGKIFILHTCGNVYEVMDDLCDLGIDAKNSFEDKIMPVEEVYHRWGKRVAMVGGVDIHLLASGSEEQVRRRTREILDACAPSGHYVLGTGNSVTNYLPLRNYLAMLDEGRKWNRDHFART